MKIYVVIGTYYTRCENKEFTDVLAAFSEFKEADKFKQELAVRWPIICIADDRTYLEDWNIKEIELDDTKTFFKKHLKLR